MSGAAAGTGGVVFLDSGVGGLPYFSRFAARNPGRALWYIADREHFPYGAKSKEELSCLLCRLLERVRSRLEPALVVLACNTASVTALDALRRAFPALPLVGTVPAVRPAAAQSKTGVIGVLGTERTVAEPYIEKLAAETGRAVTIVRRAAPELVSFIERDSLDAPAQTRQREAARWTEPFRARGVDSLVLGCTHFLLLREEFRAAAAPDMSVYDSIEGVCRRAEALLAPAPPVAVEGGRRRLLVTGPGAIEENWTRWAAAFGMSAVRFEDL
jgi:glutamate racemase